MVDEDKIMAFIRSKGPILPVQLGSEIKKDLMITGAILSDLSQRKLILISNTKVGGSPVYYLKEQGYRLQELYKHLNQKDKRAYDLLKQRQVLRDSTLTPLLRVSLRNIKDFAKPVEVTVGNQKEIFWKWYLTTSEKSGHIIKSFFEPKKPAQKESVKEEEKKILKNSQVEKVQEQQKVNVQENNEQIEKNKPKEIKPKKEQKVEEIEQEEFIQQKSSQQELAPFEEPENDTLHEVTKKFFNKKHIIIKNIDVTRKNSEIDYEIEIPSTIGNIMYYCKVKSKKTVNDSDLASAFVKGQLKKLPVLFLTRGKLTKKAKEMLDVEFENLKVKEI
jgi:cell pole-organizing protein PopZ